MAKPEPLLSLSSDRSDTDYLDRILTGLNGVRNREITALLAVVAELLVDDPAPRLRCEKELAGRDGRLPQWITTLSKAYIYRAVRRVNVFGDVDELVFGLRLAGGHELTVAVRIDHNMLSSITDAGAVPDPIDKTLAQLAESSSDVQVLEMKPADARAWIENALAKPTFAPKTESWPLYRALVRWLVGRLPQGGEHRPPETDWKAAEQLCDRFFATDSAAPFTDAGHRELLLELIETGTGDPLRWSAARVEHAIGGTPYLEEHIPLEVVLDTPDLLRAFIPFAHAQSGIRDELTSGTIAIVDALRSSYKREVLRQAKYWDLDDAV
ncbi:hypothetical protein [Mycolicibacterium celeriflavum]|uniref:hypothetical protein n=1 Tax=Mycolicibacterium celeriflavum TaxID=1249101 RepID=UPI001F453ECD|nr:hypothetical protein [Mycolicibacterium celeriflavum]